MDWLKKALKKVKKFFGHGRKDTGKSKQKCPLAETGLLVALVRVDNRRVVKEAIVDIQGKTPFNKKTDNDGLALFKPLEPDTYTIRVTLPGHMTDDFEEPEQEQETVSLGSCPIHVVRVYPLSTLKLRVVYVEGNKEIFLDGVKIKVTGPEEREETTPEVKEGWVTFEKIKSGEYELSITSMGIHKNTYDKPAGMGVYVPPGKVKEAFLRVNPNHWVEFLVVQSDTAPPKPVNGIQFTATLPGDQTVTRLDRNGLIRYEKLVDGKAVINKVASDDMTWEFVSIEVEKKQ